MSELILPAGVERADVPGQTLDRGMVVNTVDELPDHVVTEAVGTYLEEHASLFGVSQGASFGTYVNEGSLLARSKFRTPSNVFEEIALARDLCERDDDIAPTVGAMLALAYGEGMRHAHADEVTVSLFDEIGAEINLDSRFEEMHREYMIAGQFTTVSLFTRESLQFQPSQDVRSRTRDVLVPLIGVLPSEQIRVLDNDLFGVARLAYKPATARQEMWLEEYFGERTSPARKAEMRRQDPALTTMLIGRVEASLEDGLDASPAFTHEPNQARGRTLYRLNPRMVHRTTSPKGAWRYPRPLLTRNFALLEAKRLLNIMDHALLQGGANFLIVAKKGSDAHKASDNEVRNLGEVVRRASHSGVVIGDHRLSIEIITPNLDELLNPTKRKVLGRKLSTALLRIPDFQETGAGGEKAVSADVEILQRVIQSDRQKVRRHVGNNVYREVVRRNPAHFQRGAAKIWFPKIVLQGLDLFNDLILKLRDRGDIPRRWAIEAAGFDADAAIETRRREKAAGIDRILTPAAVPFSSPNQGPQDNNSGRPPGTSRNNGSGAPSVQAPARTPARIGMTPTRNAGETVKAFYDEEEQASYRCGQVTHEILEEYADTREFGRLTQLEQRALRFIEGDEWPGPLHEGPVTVVPVNPGTELVECRALRLAPGLSMLVGYRPDDDAIMARAYCFRRPEFDPLEAEELALEWGYRTRHEDDEDVQALLVD